MKNGLTIETTLLEVFVYNSRWRPTSLEAPPPRVLVTSSFIRLPEEQEQQQVTEQPNLVFAASALCLR